MTTFSSRVHESAVQFVEPVQTQAASRTTYLWCIKSGTPGIASVGKGSFSIASRFVIGGGGTGTSFAWSRLYAKRMATPRLSASRRRRIRRARGRSGRPADRRRSACGLRRQPLGLVCLLRGLVVGERLGRGD